MIVIIICTFLLVDIMFQKQILMMDSLQRIEQNIGDVIEDIKDDASTTLLRSEASPATVPCPTVLRTSALASNTTVMTHHLRKIVDDTS